MKVKTEKTASVISNFDHVLARQNLHLLANIFHMFNTAFSNSKQYYEYKKN